MSSNYIWLFGENMGKTANNNSYYFWKQVNNKADGIEKYIVLEKNIQNINIYRGLSSSEKKHVLWKNSYKHIKYYKNADLLFVTLSYLDVKPERFIRKYKHNGVSAPIIYLQHGTLGIKKIGYKGNSYWNNMFRFLYYNPDIKETLIKENDFKDYQLKYAVYHARYQELLRRYEKFLKNKNKENKSILWFITWREYFGDNEETEKFIQQIKTTITNYKLEKFLNNNNYKLKICLHQFFNKDKIKIFIKQLENINIEIVTPQEIDIMDEIAKNDILITDYSSLAFDFTFLNKKAILYQPDIKVYLKYREIYNKDEINEFVITSPNALVKELIKDNKTNKFFRSKFPEKIDYDYVKNGQHIEDLYKYFYNIQKNDITFIGYNFYGKGGSVSATKSLAEGLLYQDKLVKFISLKRHIKLKRGKFPYGINVKSFYYSEGKSKKNLLKSKLYFNRKKTAFRFDPQRRYLLPYIEVALEKKLKNIHSHTVISTRESFHTYLKKAESEFIKKKVYFFHTDYKILKEQFVGLIDKLKEIKIENAVFVTENAKNNYEKYLHYNQYQNYTIVPNCLENKFIINKNEIEPIKKKKTINAIYLLRISNDRKNDINNLIGFAKYLKEKKNLKVKIDVYGNGDYLESFLKLIKDNNLEKYIEYKGSTSNVKETLKLYDCVIDFSLNHSFGMTYLEAIMNGKMLFAMKNQRFISSITRYAILLYKLI